MAESDEFDVAVVGAGIVGLATSVALTERWPTLRVVVLEKERSLGAHQTEQDRGVVHSGIYYKPGSFKARLCRAGNESIVRFCGDHGLPYERCGKLIVASDEDCPAWSRSFLGEGQSQAIFLHPSCLEISEREPAVASVGGLWIPSTGITDYKAILAVLAQLTRTRRNDHARRRGQQPRPPQQPTCPPDEPWDDPSSLSRQLRRAAQRPRRRARRRRPGPRSSRSVASTTSCHRRREAW